MTGRPQLFIRVLLGALALALFGLGVLIEQFNDQRHRLNERSRVQTRLSELADRLNIVLMSDLQLVRGLISVINLDPALDQARFERAALPLLRERSHLRNIGAAPDMVIRLMVPLQGNEAAIGLDYRATPAQAEAADRARQLREVVVAGPVPLVQGGNGLIARLPIYIQTPQGERFWGLVSAVIDSDRLFRSVGLGDASMPIEVAIRGKDALGARGAVFLGAPALFEGQPALADLNLPHGQWRLAAQPPGGWAPHAPYRWWLRSGYALLALGLLALFILLVRAQRVAMQARERAASALLQVDAMLQGAPDAMLLVDAEGRVVSANRHAEGLFGRAATDLIGRPLEQLVPADARTLPMGSGEQSLRASAEAQAGRALDLWARRADGHAFPVEMSLSPLKIDGQPMVATAIRDVSERKAAEAELARHRDHLEAEVAHRTAQLAAAKEAAESASVAKTQFLANMSHEIRTPLNAITGMAYLIRHAGVSTEQGARLDTLETASRHLLQVINGILDLSKIESGRFELAQRAVDPQEVVDEVVGMLADSAQRKGLQLQVQMQVPPQPLIGDATRLQQALLNYVANAVRFTERGGVQLRVTVADENAQRLCLRFEVEDTGPGVEPQVLARLFNAFEQADNTLTREHGGTGLGLVITRKLAQLMGGEAAADSRPGQGSRFWFSAWLDKGQAPPPERHRPAPTPDSGPACVLLVEDDEVNRTIASFLLEDMGHRVEVAEDGEQAVAMASAQPYDLILMDMQMPRMDGLEATRHIRAQAANARTPIVAITANAFERDRRACIEAGMDDFLAKPIVPDLLYEVLGRCWRASVRPAARPPLP